MKTIAQFRSFLSKPIKQLSSELSDEFKSTLMVRAFSLTKVPLLFLISPRVIRMDKGECQVMIPFRKLVTNHVGSLYFGVLAMGADACVGLAATTEIDESGKSIGLIFKDFKAEFIKRAEGDTIFVCKEKLKIRNLVRTAIESKERVHEPIFAEAFTNGELVARFTLTLSLKLKA